MEAPTHGFLIMAFFKMLSFLCHSKSWMALESIKTNYVMIGVFLFVCFLFFCIFCAFTLSTKKVAFAKISKLTVLVIFQNNVISLPEQILDDFKAYKDDLSHHRSCCFSMFCALNSKLAQRGSHFGSFCLTIAYAESPKMVVFAIF